MSAAKPAGKTSVMAHKGPRLSDGQVWQELELFPTPPWATRALMVHVLPRIGFGTGKKLHIWEPCCGLGHMSEVLEEFGSVYPSDVHDYGFVDCWKFDALSSEDVQAGAAFCDADWIVTNPPFAQAADMLRNFLPVARCGVALLLRLAWLESEGRYAVFKEFPPTLLAPFADRVSMCEGGWDPQGSFATAYAWFVWKRDHHGRYRPASREVSFDGFLIPPKSKKVLTRPSDAALAARHVPGWIAPSVLKKQRAAAEKAAQKVVEEWEGA